MAWMAIAAAAAAATSAVVEGQAQGAQHDANSRLAEQARDVARQQGIAREDAQRRQARYALGSQTAALAESGVDPGSGSAARAVEESSANAELDALNIRYNAMMQAHGYETERMLERNAAKRSRRMGYFNAVGSAFGAGKSAGAFDTKPTSSAIGSMSGGYGQGYGIDNLNDRWGTG